MVVSSKAEIKNKIKKAVGYWSFYLNNWWMNGWDNMQMTNNLKSLWIRYSKFTALFWDQKISKERQKEIIEYILEKRLEKNNENSKIVKKRNPKKQVSKKKLANKKKSEAKDKPVEKQKAQTNITLDDL